MLCTYMVAILTHCDVVEPVEWFVDCSDCYSYRMILFTTAERLENALEIILHVHVIN